MQSRTNDHIVKQGLVKLFKLHKTLTEGTLDEVMEAVDGLPNKMPFLMQEVHVMYEREAVIPGVLNPRASSNMIKYIMEFSCGDLILVTDIRIGGAEGLFLVTVVEEDEVEDMVRKLVKGMSSPGLIMGNFRLQDQKYAVMAVPVSAYT
jgi:hypothetical protein